jgi:Flp pilus assembly protein TadG
MNKFFIRKKSEGQSIVEFALVLPVLLLLIFAIVEFGKLPK